MMTRHSLLVIGLLLTAISGTCQQQAPFDKERLTITSPAKLLSAATLYPAMGHRNVRGATPGRPLHAGAANRPATTAFVFPLQDCYTYTYRLTIGGVGSNSFVTGIVTAKNGESYTVGYAIDGAGNRRGLVQQFNHTAGIGWTRELGFANRQVELSSICQLAGGNLLVIGTYMDGALADKHLLMAELSEDGLLIWCKWLDVPGIDGVAVCSDGVNGIGFAGQGDGKMVYGRLDNAGNLVWLKQMPLMDYGKVAGMVNDDFYKWYIAFDGVKAGVHMGMLLSINPVNGVQQWCNQYGGGAANQEFIFSELAITNGRPRMAGIFSTGTGAYSLCKVTVNTTGGTEHLQVFTVPSVIFDTTARVSVDAKGRVLAFVANKTDEDIYAIKTRPEAAADTAWDWAKKFVVAGNHRYVTAQETFDGGLMLATDLPVAAGTTLVQVLKADSTGAITNCEGADFTFFNRRVIQQSVPYPLAAADVAGVLVAGNPQIGMGMLPANFSCKTLTCPAKAPEDSCLVSFARRFSSAESCDLGNDLLPLNSEVIFTGLMRNDGVRADDEEGILGRLDSRGKLLERKKIKLGNNTIFTNLLALGDGNMMVMGYSSYRFGNGLYDSGYVTLTKYTPSLQMLWNRSFGALGTYYAVGTMLEAADGSLFLNYVTGWDPFCLKIGLIKLDSNGNLLWRKEYDAPGSCIVSGAGTMTQDDQYIYLVNWTNGDASELMIKVDKTTGLPVLTNRLLMPDANQWRAYGGLAMLGEKLVMHGLVFFTNGRSCNSITLLDKNGVVVKNKCFSYLGSPFAFSMLVTRNKEIVLTGSNWVHSYYLRLDSNLNILYSKKTVLPGVAQRANREDADGSVLGIGFFNNDDPYRVDLMYLKFSFDGELGSCFTDGLPLDTASYPVNNTVLNAVAATVDLSLVVLPYRETSYSLQNAYLQCARVSGCTDIQLQAPAAVCDTLVHVARVSRNAGCTLPISFTQGNEHLKIVSSTDSTVSFKMMKSGSTMLVASIFTGCSWLRDSVLIKSTIGSGPVGLGGDTSICAGNSLVLRAGNNYFKYLWNDGSGADTLQVNRPGTYVVAVTDACANVLSDTIVVRLAPLPAISIGPDKIQCNEERVLLAAPAGFISYSWGPSYDLISMSDSQVNVFPLRDTSYFIKAEKTPGCFAFDTVAVKVSRSPAIELGPDKSFCNGDSMVLDAGAGFTGYTWSTGAVSQKITAIAKGTYTVVASNLLSCISKDTLTVITVFTNPVVQLGNDFSLCSGSSKTLNAGAYSSYLWNNLSASRTLLVNTEGLYAVRVTDQNNCEGRDTILLKSILPLPSKFLPADTLLCEYETLPLKANRNFTEYLWSTNSIDQSIVARGAGLYWLQVKDSNNCIGRDSLLLNPKQCIAGFYIPTAFSPNDDGRNELFKPLLFGTLLEYRFLIYNRYGQLIFETTKPDKGWDGKVNGKTQNSGGFTWMCQYHFSGSAAKTQKGSVVLLR